ncbi:hypothetical protein CTA2_9241 [Colletotrichum tanaceti]|uniref:Extracellular membrane protein CFEM domain-containing protein n=1 Tax=Colletotrichum tanaceti TaxID=1306861 RepID=A0A4U6XMQ3_9PEZI|nr:hypothetical protein CTA2_9241 [Colletotrichum tanaceti]TKW56979.1 hypothetical protein CTA1_13041 [Colletotrichum tanaceti]
MSLVGENCSADLDDEGDDWGKVASNVPDPPKCIETCRARFLERVVPGFNKTRYPEVCNVLSGSAAAKERLWELYCCDSTSCGVQLDGKLGQDPNVNFIINHCQNLGSGTIQDPGLPPTGYACPISSDDESRTPCPRPFMVPDPRGPLSTKTSPMTQFAPVYTTLTTLTTLTTSTSVSSRSPTRSTHSVVMKTPGVSASASASNQSQTHRHGGMPMGAKVAVGASSGVAFLAMLAFMICLFRRRTRVGHAQSIKSEIRHPTLRHAIPSSSPPPPPTPPVMSPLGSTHGSFRTLQTPPARLQERRLLRTPTSPGNPRINVSIPGTPLGAIFGQTSPFTQFLTPSPTTNKSPPRFDRSTKPYYGVPPPSVVKGTSKSGKTESMSSAASGRTATTVSNISSSFPHLVPSSPTRPPRPHENPLHIPNLVCPGPPPTRSLPSPPPRSPSSPSSPLSMFRTQQRAKSSSSATIDNGWVPPRNPARGVVLGKESKDLHDLTETCARESRERDSWGSWGVGVGGTGVGTSSIQRKGGSVHSPVLEEADLERLGGRY